MYIKEYSDLGPKERRQLAWKRQYKQDVSIWDDSMVLLTNLAGERAQKGGRVLDLGCGRGNFLLDELPNVFGERVGIDADVSATEGNVSVSSVVYGDICEDLPFSDREFDVVVSLWVFEHLADPARVLREAYRITKPGGRFFFVTPNSRALIVLARRFMPQHFAESIVRRLYGREEKDVFPVYYRANNVKDLCALGEAAGWDIETLLENADPSYTSFGKFTYWCSKMMAMLPWGIGKTHIVGVFRKPVY